MCACFIYTKIQEERERESVCPLSIGLDTQRPTIPTTAMHPGTLKALLECMPNTSPADIFFCGLAAGDLSLGKKFKGRAGNQDKNRKRPKIIAAEKL